MGNITGGRTTMPNETSTPLRFEYVKPWSEFPGAQAMAGAELDLLFGVAGLRAFPTPEKSEAGLDQDKAEIRELQPARTSPQLQQQKHKQQLVVKMRRPGIKIANKGLKRLLSGTFAGAISRTAVAPLETIRARLMVGSASAGQTFGKMCGQIVGSEGGWKGLLCGTGANVLQVAPSKAIELCAYDMATRALTPPPGCPPRLPLPVSSLAGATAGARSVQATHPLELLKTRLTAQGVYDNLLHAFVKICREGPRKLYSSLLPSRVGLIPYAATNCLVCDHLKRAFRRTCGKLTQITQLSDADVLPASRPRHARTFYHHFS